MTAPAMTDLERILAIEEIRVLRARYFRGVDGKDWAGFRALFAPDAELSFPDDVPGLVLRGAAGIAEAVAGSLADVCSVHHGHMGEISVHGADRGSGIWAMEDLLWFGAKSSAPGLRLHGYGHYHDEYVRAEGGWLFARVVLRRLRVDRWEA